MTRCPRFTSSRTCRSHGSTVIHDATSIGSIYFVGNDQVIFLHLRPRLGFTRRVLLRPTVNSGLCRRLVSKLMGPPRSRRTQGDVRQLHLTYSHCVITVTIEQLLVRANDIASQKLCFATMRPNRGNGRRGEPISARHVTMRVRGLGASTSVCVAILLHAMQDYFRGFCRNSPERVCSQSGSRGHAF